MHNEEIFLNSDCRALVIGSSGAIGTALVANLKKMIGQSLKNNYIWSNIKLNEKDWSYC